MKIVGNWNYAGTQKFVSHALNADGSRTLCGMNVGELMARRGQQWEEDDAENCGCVKCNRHLTKRALDLKRAARKSKQFSNPAVSSGQRKPLDRGTMPTILTCGCTVKVKRDRLRCSKCNGYACPKHTYSRVDESNRAITKNAPLFCVNCVEK